jgi:uncharacterized 18.2 kDa protein in rep-hol intergenic region
MEMRELIKLIEQWAIDRGLDKNGTVEGQLIKTAEEVAELIIGISKDDIDVIKDSIGDVFVTLVVGFVVENDYTENLYYDLEEILNNETKQDLRKAPIIQDLLVGTHDLIGDTTYLGGMSQIIIQPLLNVCTKYDLDITDCVEVAYKEIVDRKGVVKNGTFVKESDLV